ncbi:putative P-loop containing nucleoside triphosphate hydrolase [Medicago truncatula]|nr:putative P-loop containing nucleoside triphosphate hydrolase [Medicago truncatula]
MLRASSKSVQPHGHHTGVRIVVAGEKCTGKSTLIRAAASNKFEKNVGRLLRPIRLPIHHCVDHLPITVVDTR